jgi:hypothetical protein
MFWLILSIASRLISFILWGMGVSQRLAVVKRSANR